MTRRIPPHFRLDDTNNRTYRFAINRFVRTGLGIVAAAAIVVPFIGAPVSAAGATVAGTVFRDYNQSGSKDALEPGFAGVSITGFDATGAAVGTAVSGPTGTYSLATSTSGKLRIEFGSLPGYVSSGPQGAGSGTTEQFVDTGSLPQGGINFGVAAPDDYCQSNPKIALSCFYHVGNGGETSVHSINEDANYPANQLVSTSLGTQAQVGSVFGMAYHRSSKTLFAASFYKEPIPTDPSNGHWGSPPYGPNGASAIYKMAGAGTNTGALFVDLATKGSDASGTGISGDVSLGGLAMDSNGHTLWAINLKTKALLSIEVGSGATATVPATVPSVALPKWCEANNKGVSRAFALAAHNNELYVGGTCAGTSTAMPTNYVFSYSGGAFSASPVLVQDISYNRKPGPGSAANYLPWGTVGVPGGDDRPLLTGIAFVGEDMVTATRPMGKGQPNGEIVRACRMTATTWQMESNAGATCPGSSFQRAAGGDVNPGPGGREFYTGDGTKTNHEEAAGGGVTQIAGHPNLQASIMDPINYNSSGFGALSNATGQRVASAETASGCHPGVDLCKANGIGNVEKMCDQAPIEIGNRVWKDNNKDGLQTADEPGIAGVIVKLFKGTTLVATQTTAADGTYAFKTANVTGGIVANANDYKIVIENAAGGSKQAAIGALIATTANAGGAPNEAINSNGTIGGNDLTFPVPAGDIAAAGSNNHTYDFGFAPVVGPTTETTTSTSTTSTTPTTKVGDTTTTSKREGTTSTIVTIPPTLPPPPSVVTVPPTFQPPVSTSPVKTDRPDLPYVEVSGKDLPFTE
jgi:SdrD B-like domain